MAPNQIHIFSSYAWNRPKKCRLENLALPRLPVYPNRAISHILLVLVASFSILVLLRCHRLHSNVEPKADHDQRTFLAGQSWFELVSAYYHSVVLGCKVPLAPQVSAVDHRTADTV